MASIGIYTITSGLHDEASVEALSDEFLQSIGLPFELKGPDFSDFGSADLNVIYIRTGGAEGIFKELLPWLQGAGTTYFTLLASGKSNSLAASLEILSWLRQQGLAGEVLHGSPEYIRSRIELLTKVAEARSALAETAIGVIGEPSDWLIASDADRDAVLEKLGIRMLDIPMETLLVGFAQEKQKMVQGDPFTPAGLGSAACHSEEAEGRRRNPKSDLPDAIRIYNALRRIVEDNALGALTLRCFDLLDTIHNTGCYALARLNSEGIPSSCEGDIPALLSMMASRALTGRSGFQANPARIDTATGEILFAHCTIPFDMVDSYCFDTHFESGIGVGIHGNFPEGPVTVFKLSGRLDRAFIAEGELFANQYEQNLCRTQVWLRLSPDDARYFLTDPIGNHHIIIPGHHGALLREFCRCTQIADNQLLI